MNKRASLFLIPVVILYSFFLIIPAVKTIIGVLTNGIFFSDSQRIPDAYIQNTLLVFILTCIIQLSLSLVIVVLMLKARENLDFSQIILVFSFVPIVALSFVMLSFFEFSTGKYGFFAFDAIKFIQENLWINQFVIAFLCSIQWLGFHSIMYYLIIKDVAPEIYDSARIDGLTDLSTIAHLFRPYILPVVGVLSLSLVMSSFKAFEVTYMVNKYLNIKVGNLYTLWFEEFNKGNIDMSNKIGMIICFMTLIIIIVLALIKKAYTTQNKSL